MMKIEFYKIPMMIPIFIRNKIHNMLSDQKFIEIFTGSVWALLARVVATLISMATSIIIARAYGADILGIMAVLSSVFMLATIFTVLGTDTSILSLIPEHLTKYSPKSAFKVYRKIQCLVSIVSFFIGMLLYINSGFIANSIFFKPDLQFYFALSSVFIIFQALMVLNSKAVRSLRLIRTFAFIQLLPSLSKLIIIIPITLFFFHQDNPIYAMLASIAITALIGIWIMDRVFKKISSKNILYPVTIKEILNISLPMFMTSTMGFVIGQTGIIMLGIFRPEAEVGYYSIAVKISTLTLFVISAINTIAAPKFSELYHGEKIDELLYVARKSAKLIFWTTIPILLLLILAGKSILSLLFGPEFTIAYWAMVFLALGQFVNSCSGSTEIFMNMTGGQNIFKNIIFISMVVNIGMNFVLIPQYGMFGAAITGMVTTIVWNVAALLHIKIKFGKTICYFPGFFN